jgi:hypothetical protein
MAFDGHTMKSTIHRLHSHRGQHRRERSAGTLTNAISASNCVEQDLARLQANGPTVDAHVRKYAVAVGPEPELDLGFRDGIVTSVKIYRVRLGLTEWNYAHSSTFSLLVRRGVINMDILRSAETPAAARRASCEADGHAKA